MVESGQTAQWWSATDEVSLTDEPQSAGVQLLKQIVLLFAMHLPRDRDPSKFRDAKK